MNIEIQKAVCLHLSIFLIYFGIFQVNIFSNVYTEVEKRIFIARIFLMGGKKETVYSLVFSDTPIMKYNGNTVKTFPRVALMYNILTSLKTSLDVVRRGKNKVIRQQEESGFPYMKKTKTTHEFP